MDKILRDLVVKARLTNRNPLALNGDYIPSLALGEFNDTFTMSEVVAYQEKICQIIESNYSVAVHTEFRHVQMVERDTLGVYNWLEKEMMEGWDPIAASQRFSPETMKATVPTGYKPQKHESDLKALQMAFNNDTLTHEHLYWFKTHMSTIHTTLLSGHKKKARFAEGLRTGRFRHAERVTLTTLLSLCDSRMQELLVETDQSMQVISKAQECLRSYGIALEAALDQRAPTDTSSLVVLPFRNATNPTTGNRLE